MLVLCPDGELRRPEDILPEEKDHLNDDLDSEEEDLNKVLHPEEYPF